jgi:riboflavin kinase / FMN adenylyltransferase
MAGGEALVFEGAPGIPDTPGGTVVTVGTFDGVHRGHWAVLREIVRRARETGRRSVLLTFDPHPLAVVRPEAAPPLLTTPREKKEILAESGLDWVVFLRFTQTLSELTPEAFVSQVLRARLGMGELVIGYDHGFGRDRSGDAGTLREIGHRQGFPVDVVPPVGFSSADPISSSAIRARLMEGDVEGAALGLGRPYPVRGTVVRGDGRGRALGFPTANVRVADPGKLVPKEGVYAVRAILSRGTWPAALHLGPRPTFPGAQPSMELHLLDFDGDLYGEDIRVDFISRIREVRPFSSVEALVEQVQDDVRATRLRLAGEGVRPSALS